MLAKHAISYGNNADEPLAYIQKLVAESEKQNYRLLFDEANLAQLALRPAQARESWISYAMKRERPLEATDVEPPVIARIGAAQWSSKAFEHGRQHHIEVQCSRRRLFRDSIPTRQGGNDRAALIQSAPG